MTPLSPIVRLAAMAALLLAAGWLGSPAAAGDGSWAWPIEGTYGPAAGGDFDAPNSRYGAGHRGVDVPSLVGSPVHAVAAGVVSFVGSVAGVEVISIDHGAERSTYQPVAADVEVGDSVDADQVIGAVSSGPFHCPTPCLHLGRIANADDTYLNPLDRLSGASRIRLVDPHGPPPVPPVGSSGAGLLQRPVAGPITSPFGIRRHPITGERGLHDGVDFGAPCRTPVRAAAAGRVVKIRRAGAYGTEVVVQHTAGLQTFYGHLSSTAVDVGDPVTETSMIGRVGSTGLSTGCHLHFGVHRDGKPADPLTLL